MHIKITLAGDLGSGKSTAVKHMLAAQESKGIHMEPYATGRIVREMAEEHGVTVEEMNLLMQKDPKYDKMVDDGLIALSDVDQPMIIDSRMAWHFVRDNFSVYLSTDPKVAATRIFLDNRKEEKFSSVEEALQSITNRRGNEKARYLEKYGVTIQDLSNYHLVVDTTYAAPEEVGDLILRAAELYSVDYRFRGCYLNPARLRYPMDDVQLELVSALARSLDMGEELPPAEVVEKDGIFYIQKGAELALAHSLCDRTFVPCRLVQGEPADREYTEMKHSL